jgi:hypothetical protein
MGMPIHTVEVPDKFTTYQPDRILIGNLPNQATSAGSAAGASVTTVFTGLKLPSSYTVQVTPNQDATSYVTGKTQTGFSVVTSPRLAANTLVAGTIDLTIIA